MAEQFYTILTAIGKAQIANANVLGNKINFVKLKVGDGGGGYYNPTEGQTDVINTTWEGNINSIYIDEKNLNWIVIETIIPGDVGGFFIREAGIFDDKNNLIAIGKYPETYKPIASEGSSKDLIIKIILEISNSENVTLKIDPTVVVATKKDFTLLESKMLDLSGKFNSHLADNRSHIYYGVATGEANKYEVSVNPKPIKYEDGMGLCIKINITSTSASTINVNGLGAKEILDSLGNKIKAGTLKKDIPYTMRYNGTNFIVQGKGGGGNALPSQLLKDATCTTDDGETIGTMPNNGFINKQLGINETFDLPKGYIDGGKITQNISTKEGTIITPGTTDILIPAGTYLKGDLIIKGDSNFIANNIRAGITMFNLTGNYAGAPPTPTSASGEGDYYNNKIALPFNPSSISVSATFGNLTWSKLNGSNSVGGRSIIVSGNSFTVAMNSGFDSHVTFTYAAYQ
ncbi:phage tail protein [Clostridium sp. C2-6-12]|uniref:phage tail protein n=1 Tax=Clostridium sp. C2-6-12 TaxID=2698832 RepID=UPI00136BDC22|nr:phage tail protein [Clostridium sp. C2-6-12]